MTGPDIAGHVAYVFIMLGIWLVGRGDPKGFLAQLAGCVIWVGAGIALELSSVIIWNIIIGITCLLSYRKVTS